MSRALTETDIDSASEAMRPLLLDDLAALTGADLELPPRPSEPGRMGLDLDEMPRKR